MISLFQNNTSPSVADTIRVAGVAFDLTGSTVKFRMRLATSSTLKVDAAAVVVTPATGSVRYDWQAADVDTAGEYVAWWHVTLSGGATQDTPEFVVLIDAHAPASTDLCTVADVRTHLGMTTTDDDDLIQTRITTLSAAINQRYGRDFAPVASVARTIPVRGFMVDLGQWDLNTASSVVLHPESSSPVTLTADVDYALEPVGRDQNLGTYYRVIISPTLNIWSQAALRFGLARLQITGTWGPATIPGDVRYAAVMSVASSIDRAAADYAMQSGLDPRMIAPDRFSAWAIPTAAHSILSRYERKGV